jgi:EAL domain-containing protein (putative c-di-GMP-specific phosphodiesterase class I)
MVGHTDVELYPSDVAAVHEAEDRRVLETGEIIEFEELGPGPPPHRYLHIAKFPVVDEAGRAVGVGGIVTDITDLRAAETARAATERQFHESSMRRARLRDALRWMQPGPTIEITAAAVCAEITRHGDLTGALVLAVDPDGPLSLLGSSFVGPPPGLDLPGRIKGRSAASLRDRATAGGWVGGWPDPDDQVVRSAMDAFGIKTVAGAPIWIGQELLGILMVGGPGSPDDQLTLLGSVEEFGSLASSLLGPGLLRRRQWWLDRARVRTIIRQQAFRPVFQAVVDVESGTILGYEALTRFDDDTPPDEMFALAKACGLGPRLEAATIRAALAAAQPLPANRFIDINVSPGLVLGRDPLRGLLKRWGFGVVLEITEHEPVLDYVAFRAALAELGANVRLAIDDAGAGYASLRHIWELRPTFVKLDRELVQSIDADPVRQALIAGIVHFAERSGVVLVAEGVETAAEREALLELGVRAAQGYLFGRPAPVEELVAPS